MIATKKLTKAQLIRNCIRENPDWTASQILADFKKRKTHIVGAQVYAELAKAQKGRESVDSIMVKQGDLAVALGTNGHAANGKSRFDGDRLVTEPAYNLRQIKRAVAIVQEMEDEALTSLVLELSKTA